MEPATGTPTPASRDLRLDCADGWPLDATLYPAAEPVGAVLVAGATGVPRRFYTGYAGFLAAGGLTTLTVDYRGLAGSRRGPIRRERVSMVDWGSRDLDRALAALAEAAPGLPRAVVGHSGGGWLLGFSPRAGEVAALLTVASQVGYWGAWPRPSRYLMWAFWHAVLPAAVALWGYLPAFVLGGGEPLPAGVARDWARWGRNPAFLAGHAASAGADGYAALRAPLRAYAIAGDLYAPEEAVRRFLGLYPNADGTVEVIDQRRLGSTQPPGHFTVFRSAFREPLWREQRDWLRARLAGSAR